MILVGSRALYAHELTPPGFDADLADSDFIATQEQWDEFKHSFSNFKDVEVKTPNVKAFKVEHLDERVIYYEAYITTKGSGNSDDLIMKMLGGYEHFIVAPPEVCLAIKISHKFKKNTRNFLKTMYHIKFLESKGIKLDDSLLEIVKLRQKESLNYGHPKLNVSKETFFDDTIYTYDHDSIHEAIAILDKPAYMSYIVDGEQVMTSKEKFMSCPEHIKLLGVYEETCVLALERSQIPNDFSIPAEKSFKLALEKVCTSITSGWFRDYAYDNYHKVIAIYKHFGYDNYVKRFKDNFDMIKPFKIGDMK